MSPPRFLLPLLAIAAFPPASLLLSPLQAQQAVENPVKANALDADVEEEKADPEADPADGPKEPGDPAGKEDGSMPPLDAQISQHILKLAEGERDTRMGFMRVVIDDIVRLCQLDEAQKERLNLAAKGAAERSMKDWHEQAERYFRTRLENTDPDAAKEMLEGMGSVNFGGNRSEEEGESLDLWRDALKDVLTTEQVARYEEVLEQRHRDRIDAFARMSISSIDDHLRLTPEQRKKMSEIVQASATDYLDDVQRYWGDYFERGMLMSLANAAEEDALKTILTEQQFERLREATSNFDHFWDQKRRLKRANEKAAERRKSGKEGGPEAEPGKEGEGPGDAGETEEDGEAEVIREGGVIRGGGVIRLQGGPGIRIKVE